MVQQDHHHPPKEGGLHKFRRWREIDKNAFEMVEKKEEAKVERETLNKSLRDPIKNTNTKDPLNCTHTKKKEEETAVCEIVDRQHRRESRKKKRNRCVISSQREKNI